MTKEHGQTLKFGPLVDDGYWGEIRDEYGAVDFATLQDTISGIFQWAKEHGFNVKEEIQ